MTFRALAGCVVLLAHPADAAAQVSLAFGAGAVAGTDLVRDSIVAPLSVRPAPAPTITATLGLPLESGYSVTVGLEWARSDLEQHAAAESSVVSPLTLWTASVGIRRRLWQAVSVAVTVGGVKYVAPEDRRDPTFLRDTRAVYASFGGIVRVSPTSGRIRPAFEIRYNAHRFGTFALSNAGFTGDRFVHRVSAVVSLEVFGRR